MLKIGLTGGIGSGKTTVAKVFETLGIPVYYADTATKRLMHSDPQLKASIIKNFGEASYKNGMLDRKYIAAIVFNNEEKLALLNSLTHPVTIADADHWISQQTSPYIIKEAALLFETEAGKHLDLFIGVSAPLKLRIERVMKRDGASEEEVINRINRQMNEEEKMRRCDFVIMNNNEELIIPQVLALHNKFIQSSS